MEIGLLSDTHGYFDPAILPLLKGVDAILHAGDIGDARILDRLGKMAPLTAVFGNADPADLARRLPECVELTFAGWRLLVIHDAGVGTKLRSSVENLVKEKGIRLVVSGHSHRPQLIRGPGYHWVNPGSAGRGRFLLPRAMGRLRLGREAYFQVWDLDRTDPSTGGPLRTLEERLNPKDAVQG